MSGADTQMQTHVFAHTHHSTAWQAKEHFEWKLHRKLWKKWPDKNAVINLMSSGNTLFSKSVMTHSGRTGNRGMDVWKPWMAR